jgi:hypothetical protein
MILRSSSSELKDDSRFFLMSCRKAKYLRELGTHVLHVMEISKRGGRERDDAVRIYATTLCPAAEQNPRLGPLLSFTKI